MCPSPEPPPGLPQPAGGQRPERRPRGGQLPPSSTSAASKRHTVRGHHAASNSTAPYMREESQPHHSAVALASPTCPSVRPAETWAQAHISGHMLPQGCHTMRGRHAAPSSIVPCVQGSPHSSKACCPLHLCCQRITRLQAQVSISDTAMYDKPVRCLSTVCYAVANSILAVTAPCNSQVVYFSTNIRRAL